MAQNRNDLRFCIAELGLKFLLLLHGLIHGLQISLNSMHSTGGWSAAGTSSGWRREKKVRAGLGFGLWLSPFGNTTMATALEAIFYNHSYYL